jgi:hypothetical protein
MCPFCAAGLQGEDRGAAAGQEQRPKEQSDGVRDANADSALGRGPREAGLCIFMGGGAALLGL